MEKALEFFRQVKVEVRKVTWPTRKEATMTTMMVMVMVFVSALFFLAVDQIFSVGIKMMLGIGS